jgi:hypothetical protein
MWNLGSLAWLIKRPSIGNKNKKLAGSAKVAMHLRMRSIVQVSMYIHGSATQAVRAFMNTISKNEYDLHKALPFLHFLLFFFLTSLDWSKCIASQMAGKLSFSNVNNVLTKSHQQCLQCLPGVSTVIAHIYIVNAKKC